MTDATASEGARRLRDFRFFCRNILKIRTKAGEIRPLVPNVAQREFITAIDKQWQSTGKIRVVVLKGRQMGLSTIIGGWLYQYTSQNDAKKALVMAHVAESSRSLFDMTKRFHALCPEPIRPHTEYSTKRELSFDRRQSSYLVATAGGDGVARGETLQAAHLSEVAFWPKSSAAANFNGLLQAIPNEPGTALFVESTANGVSGVFYDLWKGAVDGSNGFLAVFLPWFIMPEYRIEPPEGFKRTPEEDLLASKFSLDDGQILFRREKVAANGRDLFMQEYPCTASEAFLTSGRPVFNSEQVAEMLEAATDPLETLALEGEEWRPHRRGELSEFYPYEAAEKYYIGADVAMGIRGGDWSVAQVLDSKKRLIARYRSHVHPAYFADVLQALGRRYNEARIIVESNNHGILTCTRLGRDLAYPNFYTEETYDKLNEEYRTRLGFQTNPKSKPLIIDQLRASLFDKEMTISDRLTLGEMQTYVVNENGQMGAEEGSDANGEPLRDDAVMSLALAHHIHEGKFTPINVTDDFYIELDGESGDRSDEMRTRYGY